MGTCLNLLTGADKHPLRPVKGQSPFARLVAGKLHPAADFVQDTLDFLGVALFDGLAIAAKTLAPDLHDADLLALPRSLGYSSAKFIAV